MGDEKAEYYSGEGEWPLWEKREKAEGGEGQTTVFWRLGWRGGGVGWGEEGGGWAKEVFIAQGGESRLCLSLQEGPRYKPHVTSWNLCLTTKEFFPTLQSNSFLLLDSVSWSQI